MSSTFKLSRGDIVISEVTGRPVLVTGKDKFRQDCREVISVFSKVSSLVGRIGDVYSLRAEIRRRLEDAFSDYQVTQNTIQRQDRTSSERFSRVQALNVTPTKNPGQNQFDQTSISYRIDVLSDDGEVTTVSGAIVR